MVGMVHSPSAYVTIAIDGTTYPDQIVFGVANCVVVDVATASDSVWVCVAETPEELLAVNVKVHSCAVVDGATVST
jgi:hypothetical protein